MEFDRTKVKFIGRGARDALPNAATIGPWRRWPGDEGVEDSRKYPNHPANYQAREDLADAVNTAIALEKPLLLTGNPGTGKTQLAERIAWELSLSPVLRFEAQSLSEANDLFYRFDLIGHLATVEMLKIAKDDQSKGGLAEHLKKEENPLAPERFVKLGPLGEAILRSDPSKHSKLFNAVFGSQGNAGATEARPSVVLIDEIDKASRDFPNDLLNGIERLEFRIRELGLETMNVDPRLKPIVIITSNSERDLPPPFLRRCTFFHIDDPDQAELEQIVAKRFWGMDSGGHGAPDQPPKLPRFYQQLIEQFLQFRLRHEGSLQYRPGTSELIDWTAALRHQGMTEDADVKSGISSLKRTASTVSKHKEDHAALRIYLDGLAAT